MTVRSFWGQLFVLMLVWTIWAVTQGSSNQMPALFIVLPDLKSTCIMCWLFSCSVYIIQTGSTRFYSFSINLKSREEGTLQSKINMNVFLSVVSHPDLLCIARCLNKCRINWFNLCPPSLLTFTKLLIRSEISKPPSRKKKETQQGHT